jgi:hypothetical protein
MMRCDEVIRELAAPTDDRDETVLAAHLAGCSSCADWARRAALLDQLWDATRPSEPSPEAWDTVWANITRALESHAATRELSSAAPKALRNGFAPKLFTLSTPIPALTHPTNQRRPRRFLAIALIGLAQAAAILIAVGLAWHPQRPAPIHQNQRIAHNTDLTPLHQPSAVRGGREVRIELEFDEGQVMKICLDGTSARVQDLTPPEMAYRISSGTFGDPMLVMFNIAESLATTPVVASR